jgi:hypothetical protein
MSNDDTTPPPDPVDAESAQIDARDPHVIEQIEDVKDDARALGRDADQPVAETDAGPREN